jgi:anti-sigma factor ChrR (cupin superfamily)
MGKKSAHPEFRLFEYLNGKLDRQAAQVVDAHLSVCDDCASVARLIRELKESAREQDIGGTSRVSSVRSQAPGEHPDLSELASFFYAGGRSRKSGKVAAHVALCGFCGDAIAQYARAENAAVVYNSAAVAAGAVPAAAWEMIRDWEDSSFAKAKPASEVLGPELLMRLARTLDEQQPRKLERDTLTAKDVERVPVLIVSSSGEIRSVEFFEKEFDSTGASVLRHSEGSARFDNKALLALFGFGGTDSFVVLNPILRDTIRLERVRPEEESLRADYIIIED